MSLYQRLHEVNQNGTNPAGPGAAPTGGTLRRDPIMDELRQRIHAHLIDELGPILYDNRLSGDELRRKVHEQLLMILGQERAPLSAADKAQLIQEVSDDILGYGPIDKLLSDDNVSEVMVNGPDMVFVERGGKVERHGLFAEHRHPSLHSARDQCLMRVGGRANHDTVHVRQHRGLILCHVRVQ